MRVYYTSPEEQGRERAVFEDVIAEADDLKARVHGLHLKPVSASGSKLGRLLPKALQHKDLLEADLVVATLWRHWGAPAERFEADVELARAHGKEIWLYVRALDAGHLARPDEPLRRVLDFRDRIEREGGVRCYPYADESDWREQFLTHVYLWLDGLPLDPPPGPVAADDLDARLDALAASPAVRERLGEVWRLAAEGRLTRASAHFAGVLAEAPEPAVLLEYARFLGETGALEQAEVLCRRAHEADAAPPVERLVAAAYGRLGSAYEKRGNLDEARRLYRQSLHLNERLDDAEGLAADYGSLGNVYWMLGELEKAEHAYREALRINERLGRHDGMATDYGNLGNVYGVWGRLDAAEQMYRKALAINERLGRRESMAHQYGNLGIVYRVQGRLDEAEAAYRKALALHEALGRREGMAEDYNNLGNVYQEAERLDEAEAMYRKALEIDEALGRREGMANQYGNLGVVYQSRGAFDEAEAMYRKSLAIFETLGDFVTIEQVRAWISDLEARRRAR